MGKLKALSDWLLAVFVPLGGWGLLLIAFFDSSFLSFPEINDVLIVTLSIAHPHRMVYYCAMTLVGSILGCLALFAVGRKGGETFLKRKFKPEQIARIGHWYERYGILTVVIPSILPPPTPFKVFVFAAGALQVSYPRFIFGITLGRSIRYFSEGYLAVKYGRQALEYMRENYPPVAIGIAIVFAAGFLAYVLMKRRKTRTSREAATREG